MRIYLDFSATTPILPAAFDAMRDCESRAFGNASSVHAFGRDARVALEDARTEIAKAIHALPAELIFTSGGTESIAFAIAGLLERTDPKRRTIVTAATEHAAVLETCAYLERRGYRTRYIESGAADISDRSDRLSLAAQTTPDALAASVDEDTALVALMHANNENGTVNNIAALAKIAHERGALFFTDAVQSFGKIPVDVKDLGVDAMAMCAHKMYGPKGIGALFVKAGVGIEPLVHGGSQERNRRGGTESVALAVGWQIATREAMKEMRAVLVRTAHLKNTFMDALRESIPGIVFTMHPNDALPNIVGVTFDYADALEPEAIVPGMDLRGFAVSNGAACTSGSLQPSHVLKAIGYADALAACAVRFSIGRATTEEELLRAAKALGECAKQR